MGNPRLGYSQGPRSLVLASRLSIFRPQVPYPDLPVVPDCSAVCGAYLFGQKLHGQEIFSDTMIRIEEEKLLLRPTAHESSNTVRLQHGGPLSAVTLRQRGVALALSPRPRSKKSSNSYYATVYYTVLYSTVVSNFDTYIFLMFWQIQERKRLT